MKQRPITPLLVGAILTAGLAFGAVGAGSAATATSPAGETSPIEEVTTKSIPTWEEFKSTVPQAEFGVYVVNGDTPVLGEQKLFEFYTKLANNPTDTIKDEHDGEHADLIINTDSSGEVTQWSADQAANLTYCVSDRFGSRKAATVAGMEAGAAMWENASPGVNYVYDSSQDANCNNTNNNVLFSVEPTTATSYLARAFFPDYPRSARNVLVANGAYSSSVPLANILGHELGHTLGFRHEHTRPEAGTCFEDFDWVELTPYDSDSIMHYPQCNGTSRLTFSQFDGEGVRKVYGS